MDWTGMDSSLLVGTHPGVTRIDTDLAGNPGLNPPEGMHVCLSSLLLVA
jgi:hypothetical protein